MHHRNSMMLAVALALFASPVAAQNAPPLMQRLDLDRDGALSRSEVDAARTRVFERLDRDGDGALSQEEIENQKQVMATRAEMLRGRLSLLAHRRDANGDGVITLEEWLSGPDLFAVLDRDGDDRLSADEIVRLREAMLARGR